MKGYLNSFGSYSPAIFVLIQISQVVMAPIPGGPIEFLGGYLFGTKGGFIYSMIGLVLGSLFAFWLARIFQRCIVEKFVSPKTMRKFDYLISHEGVILSFLLFLAPCFPKDALCYLLGLTPMNLGVFLIVSTIGRMPGTLIASMQGAKAFNHQYAGLLFLLGSSALVVMVFYFCHDEIHELIKRLHRRRLPA